MKYGEKRKKERRKVEKKFEKEKYLEYIDKVVESGSALRIPKDFDHAERHSDLGSSQRNESRVKHRKIANKKLDTGN